MEALKKRSHKLTYRNISDEVYSKIKEKILKTELKPGDHLQQINLSKQYNISRAPIRDALKKLEGHGLVNIIHSKALVTSFNLEKFKEIYEIRKVLEKYAIKEAVLNLNKKDIVELKCYIGKMKRLYQKNKLLERVRLDRKFHLKIYEAAKKPILYRILINLYNSTNYTSFKSTEIPDCVKVADKDHDELLKAMQKKDAKLCGTVIKRHINNSLNLVLKKNLKQY